MATKYLDYNGLLYFWGKVKAWVTGHATTRIKVATDTYRSQEEYMVSDDSMRQIDLSSDFAAKADKTATVSGVGYNTSTKKITETINGTTSDVVPASTIVTDGGGVTAVSYDTTNKKITRTINGAAGDVVTAATIVTDGGGVLSTEKGAANGVATLDSSGLVPSSQLPSYVDDVVESYPVSGATELTAGWLSLTAGGSAFTPEAGKIYVLMTASTSYDANSQFRWGGTAYVKMADGGVSAITNAEIDVICV